MAGVVRIGDGSQGEIIDFIEANYTGVPGDNKFIKSIDGGICYMLSLEWLNSVARDKNGWMYEYGTIEHAIQNEAYYKQIARNFQAYVRDIEEENGTAFDFDKKMYNRCTDGVLDVVNEFMPIDSQREFVDSLMAESGMYTIGIDYENPNFGHQVAAYYNKVEKRFYFYDPNYGVSLVTCQDEEQMADMINTFLITWWNSYADDPIKNVIISFVQKTGKQYRYEPQEIH